MNAKPRRPRRPPAGLRALRSAFRMLGPVFPGLMARYAYRLWFRTHRFRRPPRELAYLESARRLSQRVGRHRVALYMWGEDGPNVLLMHGWNGRGSQMGAFAEPLRAAGYRVLALDAPGHGDSSGRRTSILEVADVLLALERDLGPFTAAIGHSFGVPCLTYAASQGLTIGRMVGISPPADFRELINNFQRALNIPPRAGQLMRQRLEQRYGGDMWDRLSPVGHARGLSQPALFLHDTDDRDVPWQDSAAIVEAWRGARLQRTEGLGHRRILRDQEVINTVVAFLAAEGS